MRSRELLVGACVGQEAVDAADHGAIVGAAPLLELEDFAEAKDGL